jgi:hypothetical protein
MNTHPHVARRIQRAVPSQAAWPAMTAVPCIVIMACFLLHNVEEGVTTAHPSRLRIRARVMAGDRLQGIKSPWRGLYMYSQLFSCRIH